MLEPLINSIRSKISLTAAELEEFKKFWREKKIAKNEFLFRNGETCNYDSYVVQGSLKAYFVHPETGKEEIIFFAIEGWWATDLESFANRTPSIYNIRAIENSHVVQIHHKAFEELLTEIPRLEKYFRLILQGYTSAIQRRIVTTNALSAEERFLDFAEKYPLVIRKVPQYLIASYLGITPAFLSRIKARTLKR